MTQHTSDRVDLDLGLRERNRLKSLDAYGLATVAQATAIGVELGDHATLARNFTNATFAAISIVGDTYQQTIAATEGRVMAVRDRRDSICSRILYAAGPDDLFVTADASRDPDLWDHPWVTGELGTIRFYAGAQLVGREGLPLGVVCVFSYDTLSAVEAERAGQRLIPVRDRIVALLDDRRDAGETLAEQTIENDYLADEIAQLVRAPHSAAIDAVINDGAINTLFQPIVHIETNSIAAFEALTRGPAGTELESPMALLDAARSVGRLGELDWLCRTSAMVAAAGSSLPRDLSWFINVEPAGLELDCPAQLRPALDRARSELRVVLEVVERDVEQHVTRLLHATDQARRDAWGVALDDVGAQSGSLALLPLLQPDVVKLDMSLLRQAPTDTAADITAAVRSYAERTGAVILAEGIETVEQEEWAKILGATYGQGYLYGRPGPLPASVPAPAQPVPIRQRPAVLGGSTPFETLNEAGAARRARPEQLRHIVTHLRRFCGNVDEGAVLLAILDSKACYLHDQSSLDTLAETNAFTVCLVPDVHVAQLDSRYYVGPLPHGSRLTGESAMIVIAPHYAGALVTRQTDDARPDGTPLVDFIYTHDREATIAAARAYLDHMQPGTIIYPSTSAAAAENRHTEQSRRTRLAAYLAARLHPATLNPR